MNEVVTKANVDYLRLYEYDDLSQFQGFGKNRQIRRNHVNNIKKDIIKNGIKYIPPITVDINSKIIGDGNHRAIAVTELYAEGKLKEPLLVRYIDAPTDEKEFLQLIIDLNVKSKHWNLSDFIHAGNMEGSPISKLIDFCSDVNRPLLHKTTKKGKIISPNYRYGMAITIGKNDTKNITNNTTVDITEEDFDNGAKYYVEATKVIEALGLSDRINTWLEAFLQAWHDVRKDPAYSEMIDKIGIDAICNSITPSDFTTTKKEQWESAFKSLIWNINSRL